IAVVRELEGGVALRIDDPRGLQSADLQEGLGARAGGGGAERSKRVAGGVDAMRVAVAAVDQPRRRRGEGELSELLVALALELREGAVEILLVVALRDRPVVRAVEVEAI